MRTINQLSMEKSAQAWCGDKTKHKEMDVDLCMEFAKILDGVWSKPWLGNATTHELLKELKSRLGDDIITWFSDEQLSYKTVS